MPFDVQTLRGFFGSSPSVSGGEFKSADDIGMTEHEDVGRWGDLLTGYDFGLAEEIGDKVERMDVKVEQGITLWIVASEIMEVITDKMLFAQMLLKDLHGRKHSVSASQPWRQVSHKVAAGL